MSHRKVRKEDFIGKTIADVNCKAVNILTFYFTDGTALALEGELFHEIPTIVACEACVQKCAPRSKVSASTALREKWALAERHERELEQLQARCTHTYDNGNSAAQNFAGERLRRCVGCGALVPRLVEGSHEQICR